MEIGVTVRVMGPQATRTLLGDCARAAEDAGFESLWLADHIAIPPDDAEGSGGRYLDILATLAWLAGITSRIRLGTGVLVLPYRAALPTAKQVATVQELSGGRVLLGVGIGWMEPEFRALGVDLRARGRISDATLDFLNRAFAADEVELNGQRFLFRPRPERPPVLVGGRAPHALVRAVKYGDGWFPMSRNPANLVAPIAEYHAMTAAAGKPRGNVTASVHLPLQDRAASRDLATQYRAAGVDRMVAAVRYDDLAGYRAQLDVLRDLRTV
ncbi:MAG: TIGR03619 family F420-dependent LLM class oxidoreductase [Pseudomonadota bacterium]|nr:TIGR03619 family F420-dependent LLM class oxidoreductase [Pseudomonadota bacterium]